MKTTTLQAAWSDRLARVMAPKRSPAARGLLDLANAIFPQPIVVSDKEKVYLHEDLKARITRPGCKQIRGDCRVPITVVNEIHQLTYNPWL